MPIIDRIRLNALQVKTDIAIRLATGYSQFCATDEESNIKGNVGDHVYPVNRIIHEKVHNNIADAKFFPKDAVKLVKTIIS